jgi:hypothetical protein
MIDHDPRHDASDARRPTRRRRARSDDSARVADNETTTGSPDGPESRYSAAAPSEPRCEPLTVRVELVVIDGPAGKELLNQQATVVRAALQWFADHRLDEHSQQPEAEPPHHPPRSRRPADRPPPRPKTDDAYDDT